MQLGIDKSLKSEYLTNYDGLSQIDLIESNVDLEYTFLITNLDGKNMYSINDIDKLKNNYLIKKNSENKEFVTNPKDCDYILIDDNNNLIFYIELKQNDASDSKNISEQLEAGRKWLEHFLFCSNVDISELDNYTEIKLCIRYDEKSRVSKSRPLIGHKNKYGFYEIRGRKIKYSRIKNHNYIINK